MNETLFTDLVREWGDFLLEGMTAYLYESTLINILMYLVFIGLFVSLGRALIGRDDVLKYGQFFLCWLAILPVEKKPVLYHALNSISTSVSYLFQKGMYNILTVGDTRKVLPPGFVFDSVIRAGTADIEDQATRADIRYLIDHCMPSADNEQGNQISALDLFGGRVTTSDTGIETYTLPFDKSLLQNRSIPLANGDTSNCYELLINTRSRVRRMIRAQEIDKTPDRVYVGANHGGTEEESNVTTWNAEGGETFERMKKISLNLAESHAYQKTVLRDYFRFPEKVGSWGEKGVEEGTLSPLSTLSAHAFSGKRISFGDYDLDPTRIISETANYPAALARSLGLDGAVDAGFTIHEMNDHLVSMPMKISAVQMWLKFIAPLIVLLILIPKCWSVVTAWSLAWFFTILTPVIMMFSRSLANQIIFWGLRLDEVLPMASGHPALLNTGVNFEGSNALMKDASVWMASFLEVEKFIWTSLFMLVPLLGGAFTHFKVKNMLKAGMEVTGQQATRSASAATVKGIKTGIKVAGAKYVLPAISSGGIAATAAASQAFRKIYSKTRGPHA